jgi:formamidopyrimidine-DNA glycosylase
MPELPEVEIARENLESWLTGRTVSRARVHDARVLRGQSPATLTRALRGARVGPVRRRAKYLLADLPGRRRVMLVHLGMSGKMLLAPDGGELPRWSRVVLHVAGGDRVAFRDSRVFGRFQVYPTAAIARLPELTGLGPEPLSPGFRSRHLARALRGSRTPIKVLLLDQRRVAGLGNIQSAESLFRAGLHPGRPADSLDEAEIHRLWKSIRASLRDSLREQRGPVIEYVEEPGAGNPFLVYGREGEPCPRCGGSIARIVQSARSTYFCPRCQPVPRRGKRKRR